MSKKAGKLGPRVVQIMEFWSDIDDVIPLTAAATNDNLPDVVVSGLPDEAEIFKVVAVIRVRATEDTNGAGGANGINGVGLSIDIKASAGAWGADEITAIDLADNQWLTAQGAKEVGQTEQEGDNDLSSVVDGDDTYNLRFANNSVDLNNLDLIDVQVGLKIYFTTIV